MITVVPMVGLLVAFVVGGIVFLAAYLPADGDTVKRFTPNDKVSA